MQGSYESQNHHQAHSRVARRDDRYVWRILSNHARGLGGSRGARSASRRALAFADRAAMGARKRAMGMRGALVHEVHAVQGQPAGAMVQRCTYRGVAPPDSTRKNRTNLDV